MSRLRGRNRALAKIIEPEPGCKAGILCNLCFVDLFSLLSALYYSSQPSGLSNDRKSLVPKSQ